MKFEITPKGGSDICPAYVELDNPVHVYVAEEALLLRAVSTDIDQRNVMESVLLQNNIRALNRYEGNGAVRLGCSDIQPHDLIGSLLDLSALKLRNYGVECSKQELEDAPLPELMERYHIGWTAQEMAHDLGKLSCGAAALAINIDRSRTILVQ